MLADVFLILCNSPGCPTLSKAWLTCMNTDVQYSLLLMASRMVWVIGWHCWIVEWARINPNWRWGIQSLAVKSGSILRKISLSKSFAIIGNRLIRRQDFTSFGSLPGLEMKIFSANFSLCLCGVWEWHWISKRVKPCLSGAFRVTFSELLSPCQVLFSYSRVLVRRLFPLVWYVLWVQLVVLIVPGIQSFLRQVPAHAVGIHPRGFSRILLLFLCHCLPVFLESVSKRRGGGASIGLHEDLMGFQTELLYRLKSWYISFK